MSPFRSSKSPRNGGKLIEVFESRSIGGGNISDNPNYPEIGGPLFHDSLLGGSGIEFKPCNGSGGIMEGYLGPLLSNCRADYASLGYNVSWVNDSDYFNVTTTGIQVFTIPQTESYRIVMESPTHSNGGDGVKLEFDYSFEKGEKIYILAGQRNYATVDSNTSRGGCGATYLVKKPGTTSNVTDDLLNCNLSHVIAVCGAPNGNTVNSKRNATTPGNHPSSYDTEDGSTRFGSGRGAVNYYLSTDDGGPSGGAGFLRSAGEHNANGSYVKIYSEYEDSTAKIYAADCFVRGGTGGRGYDSSGNSQGNGGLNGSGGFGGGGGQNSSNSYHPGAGGMIGGTELMSGSDDPYPSNMQYGNGATKIGGGSSYLSSSSDLTLLSSGVSSMTYGYVKIKFTP